MVGINFSIVGNMCGFMLPLLFVTADVDHSTDHQTNVDLIKGQLEYQLIAMACVETVLFVLLFIFYKERKEEELNLEDS